MLDGVKQFISDAGEAAFLVVFAKTDPAAGARGVSAFVVERDAPGISVSRPERLMGIRSAHAFAVTFDGVRVPAATRLGEEGAGFRIAMKVLDNSRLDVAATAIVDGHEDGKCRFASPPSLPAAATIARKPLGERN